MRPRNNRYQKLSFVFLILITLSIPLIVLFVQRQQEQRSRAEVVTVSGVVPNTSNPALMHFIGGAGVVRNEWILDLVDTGGTIALNFDSNPSTRYKIKFIDGFIARQIMYYECHKSKIFPPLKDTHLEMLKENYCDRDFEPSYNNDDLVFSTIKKHIDEVKENKNTIGFAVLDHIATWDKESYAKPLLHKIRNYIKDHTTNKPTICIFDSQLGLDHQFVWDSKEATEFTPAGCDMVGLYVTSIPQKKLTNINAYAFDWSMKALLPRVIDDLQEYGWSPRAEPLIGMVQAWGGPLIHDFVEITPTRRTIQTQMESFCNSGAAGIIAFAWSNPQGIFFPWNTPELKQGITLGATSCKNLWGK